MRPAFQIPATVLFRDVQGQMVLRNLETEQYFGLNEVGADILSRITSEPLALALSALIRDYDVDADVLRRDVNHLVDVLVGAGLLLRVEPPS